MATTSLDKTFGPAKSPTPMSAGVQCGMAPTLSASTLDSLSLASLPTLNLGGSCSPTWESLPPFDSRTLDSLPSFDDCEAQQSVDIEDYHVDYKHWGSAAIRRSGYDLGSLANGRFGVVGSPMTRSASTSSSCVMRTGTRQADGGGVIIKAVASASGKVPLTDRRTLLREFCLLRTLRHEAVVRAEAMLETKFDSWLVLDFPTTTTVQSYVDSRGPLQESAATGLFAQLLHGLAHIHGFGVAHSGVSPSSMLFDDRASSLKITDFGHARFSSTGCSVLGAQDDDAVGPCAGSVEQAHARVPSPALAYQAPEQLLRRRWNERVDIWSAGLSFHFKLLSRLPFDVQDDITLELLKAGRLCGDGGLFGGMPVWAANMLRRCLAVPALSRPSASELLQAIVLEKTSGRDASA